MTALFAAHGSATPPADLHVGQAVHVNARTAWLAATVTSIAPTCIGVAYTARPPAAVMLAPAVAPWVVRPADGVRLRRVRQLQACDDLVAFDGTVRTVAAVWQRRDGWWVIADTAGRQAVVPPTAVLRLTEPTPLVTVNGHPLPEGLRAGDGPASMAWPPR